MTQAPDLAAFTRHGGALDVARAMFPDAPEPWVDLSTGINPRAYPPGPIPARAWTSLPDAATVAALEAIARRRYRVAPEAAIVAAPGTQAVIQRLPALAPGRDVRLLGPTYGEYAAVYARADRAARTVPTLDALAGADVAIVVNPNNPDGRLVAAADLATLARGVGTLVVDEAFMDALDPGESLAPAPPERAIVLRSFGKMYGLAGARLGFAIAAPDVVAALRRQLGPWAVSGPALDVAARALGDDAWLTASRARLVGDAARLAALLDETGARLLGGTPLFGLYSHQDAPGLFTALARHGVLVRPFAAEPAWLRFGTPGAEPDWARLTSALASFG